MLYAIEEQRRISRQQEGALPSISSPQGITLTTNKGTASALQIFTQHNVGLTTSVILHGTRPVNVSTALSATVTKRLTKAVTLSAPSVVSVHVPAKGFRAHKNGTNQTSFPSATFTQVTFGTEAYDSGNYFASSAWTPPSGYVRLMASTYATGTVTINTTAAIAIYKNGAIFQQSNYAAISGGAGPINVIVDDNSNGSDVYTVRFLVTGSSLVIDGTATYTWFSGYLFP